MFSVLTSHYRLSAATEQRESPRREFEGQMKMFVHGIDPKAEYCDIQKRRVRDLDPGFSKICPNTELYFVRTTRDTEPFRNWVFKMSGVGTYAFGHQLAGWLDKHQLHSQPCSRNASGHIYRVNGDTSGVNCIVRILHWASGLHPRIVKRIVGITCDPNKHHSTASSRRECPSEDVA